MESTQVGGCARGPVRSNCRGSRVDQVTKARVMHVGVNGKGSLWKMFGWESQYGGCGEGCWGREERRVTLGLQNRSTCQGNEGCARIGQGTRGLFDPGNALMECPRGDIKEAAGSGSWGPGMVRVGG